MWRQSGGPADSYGALSYTQRTRARRVRWWLRAGAWLAVTGVTRLARIAQVRWPRLFLVTGLLLMVIGVLLRSTVAFVAGLLVAGSSAGGQSQSATAAMVRMSEQLHNRQTEHR